MSATLDPDRLWFDTVDEVKRRIVAPSFWQALEALVPIMLDNDILVVGLPAAMSMHGAMVNGQENQNRVQVILEELAGRPLDLRVIEGTDPDDWEFVKKKEAAGREAQQRVQAHRERAPGIEESWEGLLDLVTRMFQRQPLRQLPQMRGVYLKQVLPVVAQNLQRLAGDAGLDDERVQRQLARVLDRVAGLIEVPASLVGYELVMMMAQSKPAEPSG